MNVTVFVDGSIVYSPTFLPFSSTASTGVPAATGFPSLSRRTAELALIATDFSTPSIVALPGANTTVPDCASPWIFEDSAGVAVGLTPTIDGVYFVSTLVPLLSSACTFAGTTGPT